MRCPRNIATSSVPISAICAFNVESSLIWPYGSCFLRAVTDWHSFSRLHVFRAIIIIGRECDFVRYRCILCRKGNCETSNDYRNGNIMYESIIISVSIILTTSLLEPGLARVIPLSLHADFRDCCSSKTHPS